MAGTNADTNNNTNLASEYLMMSLLFHLRKDSYLSLGNKKGVDIIVKKITRICQLTKALISGGSSEIRCF